MDADRLLSGPRGRGFLFALAESHELMALAHRARTSTQPAGSAFSFGWFESEEDREAPAEEREARLRAAAEEHRREMSRPVPAAELAAAIRAAAPTALPDALTLVAALASTVDDARPWQSPDPIEAFLVEPEVLDALRPIAELVAGAIPGAPIAEQQWGVVYAGQEGNVPPPLHEVPAWETRAPSDAWWSMPPHGLPRTTGALPGVPDVPAGLVLVEDAIGATAALVTEVPPPSARVFEIATAKDFARLAADFPRPANEMQRDSWRHSTGRDGDWIVPDWPAVAKHWDGVRLTIAAYLEGATRPLDVGGGQATFIAGWSPDATFWFVPAPASGPATRWRHTSQLGWRPAG